jgi:hypothetical protein
MQVVNPVDAPKQHGGPYSRHITIDGDTMYLYEWAELYGISKHLILRRISQGWSEERAVTTPAHKHVRRKKREQ